MGKKIATFVFLTDPQQGDGDSTTPNASARFASGKATNVALNALPNTRWPPNGGYINISCSNEIVQPDAVFFAGDLTEYGGNFNLTENSNLIKYNPSNYTGGPQLQDHRALYDGWNIREGVPQLSRCGPLYFGLGNHGMHLFCISFAKEMAATKNLSLY